MPLGDDIFRVKALTANSTFLDYHRNRGADYNPEIGDRGFMYETEAYSAEAAGDVLVCKEETAQTMVTDVPRAGTVTAFVPGDGEATHIAQFQPCVYDDDYTITVTMAIDGGGDLTAVTTAGVTGGTAETAAADLAGQVVAGVALVLSANKLNVYFTPDDGAFTKFEVAVTATVAARTTRHAPTMPEEV